MKELTRKISKFIGQNWFKLILLALVVCFLLIIKNGIKIDHRGYIESAEPGFFDLNL
jgi:hypothetical protein